MPRRASANDVGPATLMPLDLCSAMIPHCNRKRVRVESAHKHHSNHLQRTGWHQKRWKAMQN